MITKNLTKNKYIGIHQSAKISLITRLIYKAKFLQETEAINEICSILILQLHNIDFDFVVAVQPTKSKFSLPHFISQQIADNKKCRYLKTGLKKGNKEASKNLKGKKVLIIDDVVYSGKTAKKAITAVKKQKPEKIFFLAIAHSNTNYKLFST